MATNLSEMIDLSLRVSVVVVYPLMLGHFDSNLRLCFQMTAYLVDAADLHRYTQIEWENPLTFLQRGRGEGSKRERSCGEPIYHFEK